eukprot:7055461-Prymnesium_polylepis.1
MEGVPIRQVDSPRTRNFSIEFSELPAEICPTRTPLDPPRGTATCPPRAAHTVGTAPERPPHTCRVRWGDPLRRITPYEPPSRVSKPRRRAERAEKTRFCPKTAPRPCEPR